MEDVPAKKATKNNNEKVAHKERKEPYNALERREREKKKQPEEKKATRNVKKEENDIKEEQVEKGLRTSPHKSSQK